MDEGLLKQQQQLQLDPRTKNQNPFLQSSTQQSPAIQNSPLIQQILLQQQLQKQQQSNAIQSNPVSPDEVDLSPILEHLQKSAAYNQLLNSPIQLQTQQQNQALFLKSSGKSTFQKNTSPSQQTSSGLFQTQASQQSVSTTLSNYNSAGASVNTIPDTGINNEEKVPAGDADTITLDDVLPSGQAYRYFVNNRGRAGPQRPRSYGQRGRRPNQQLTPPTSMQPAQPQYQLVIRQEPPQQSNNNNNNPINNNIIGQQKPSYNPINQQQSPNNNNFIGQTVSASMSFKGSPSANNNVVYGQNSVQTPTYLQRAESRADNPSVFPSFILNPRAASNAYLNRVTRTVPKAGVPRLINNVPIRQYQWPDYVDN